jgi:hypothetical protein
MKSGPDGAAHWPFLTTGRVVMMVALLLAMSGMAAQGQTLGNDAALDPHNVDGTALGSPISLGSRWLAQQGDDPRWSDPQFDDSQWQVVNTGEPLGQQGMKGVDAVWYRTHMRIPPTARHLALLVLQYYGSAQIFVNGTEIGGWGSFGPGGDFRMANIWTAPIPDAVLGRGELTIAIRGRIGRVSHGGANAIGGVGALTGIKAGPSAAINDAALLQGFRDFTSNATNLTILVLVLVITLALALTVRHEPEYRALAVALTAQACSQIEALVFLSNHVKLDLGSILFQELSRAVFLIALVEFVRIVLQLHRSRFFTIYYWLLGLLLPALVTFLDLYWGPGHDTANPLTVALSLTLEVLTVPAVAGLPLLALWIAWKRRNRDALLLFVPLLINASVDYFLFSLSMLRLLHWIGPDTGNDIMVPIRSFLVGWDEMVSFAFSITLLLFLVVRTVRLAREKAAAASEMQAVKTLQGLLLARESQATPGYAVETVYRPALEVGGDFFLVSPGADGSIVVIVGDVSGKGLLAAMRVSLILGALNRESSRQPAEVLSRLNHALLGQGEVGFTTACCVRVEEDGDFSFANAGHLNPYVDGREVEAPGALPLGIHDGQTYEPVTGHLDAGQRMVLLSDGVVEARSKRSLLGFEKLVELTRLTPGEIADAAQKFGQEDDITVLTLTLLGAGVVHA